MTPDYPLFESSLLDSLSVYEIQGFLEDEFDIDVSEEDLVVEKIGSVRALARFAEARMHDGTGAR